MIAHNIAIVIPYRFVPPHNGGQQAAFGFCEFLSKEAPVTVISSSNNATEGLPFRFESLFADRFFKYFNPFVAWRFFCFFRKRNIRTCIIQQPFIGLMLLPITRWLGIRLVVYVHNIEFQRFRSIGKWWWRLLYPIEYFIYRNADFLLFISPEDMKEALPLFGLPPHKNLVIPYGTRLIKPPSDKAAARHTLHARHPILADEKLILFFGPQSYKPNQQAVKHIVHDINPLLLQKMGNPYRILLCGGGLPKELDYIKKLQTQNIHYLGFVEDIDTYIKAADVVVNPIQTGGGVKTKIIEAIAWGTTVVSTETGAKGVERHSCKDKLLVAEDENWEQLAALLHQALGSASLPTPDSFYETYHWARAIQPFVAILQSKLL